MNVQWRSCKPEAGRHQKPAAYFRSRRSVQVVATHCPYKTLGVSNRADEKEIKQAYRRLALQYHPDVNQTHEAERKFLSIQQAYELLTGKTRHSSVGPNTTHQANNWEFHDWYWNFMTKRRWQSRQPGAATSVDPAEAASKVQQPEHKATLRSQLAGLRQRAAIRNTTQQRQQQQEQDGADSSPTAGGVAGDVGTKAAAAAAPELEYDSSEMSDGVNMAPRAADPWAQTAAPGGQRKFTATNSHKEQVMMQMAGLKRKQHLKVDLWE